MMIIQEYNNHLFLFSYLSQIVFLFGNTIIKKCGISNYHILAPFTKYINYLAPLGGAV